jgi:hypothetical protein
MSGPTNLRAISIGVITGNLSDDSIELFRNPLGTMSGGVLFERIIYPSPKNKNQLMGGIADARKQYGYDLPCRVRAPLLDQQLVDFTPSLRQEHELPICGRDHLFKEAAHKIIAAGIIDALLRAFRRPTSLWSLGAPRDFSMLACRSLRLGNATAARTHLGWG